MLDQLQLPREPDEQLRLGMRVVELAYDEKARLLKEEILSLRAYGQEKQYAHGVFLSVESECSQPIKALDGSVGSYILRARLASPSHCRTQPPYSSDAHYGTRRQFACR